MNCQFRGDLVLVVVVVITTLIIVLLLLLLLRGVRSEAHEEKDTRIPWCGW